MLFLRIKRFFLFPYQKLTRGFSDKETWNLDETFAKLIAERLKRFKQVTNGHPTQLTPEKWDKILDEMITGFEDYATYIYTPDFGTKESKGIETALKHFRKYFYHLWW